MINKETQVVKDITTQQEHGNDSKSISNKTTKEIFFKGLIVCAMPPTCPYDHINLCTSVAMLFSSFPILLLYSIIYE